MDFADLGEWLLPAFIGWVLLSVVALPFVGRFLVENLHERTTDETSSPIAASVEVQSPTV